MTQSFFETIKELFCLEGSEFQAVKAHEGGRNQLYICNKEGMDRFVLRVSLTCDRTLEDYKAETEFIHYLAGNGAPVADAVASLYGRRVEEVAWEDTLAYVSLFNYAPGMLMVDNGYRYRDGAPLTEYFYNTGKALGRIHELSKSYHPKHKRYDFFDKFNEQRLNKLLPRSCAELRIAVANRLERLRALPKTSQNYGLVHFDFYDGNYHVDMESGDITVFDFDNCLYNWYMYDVADLWRNGTGWYAAEPPEKRKASIEAYFKTALSGYRSETLLDEEDLKNLPLFLDILLIEGIADECERAALEGGEADPSDFEDEARCLIENIPYMGYFEE